MTLSEYQSKAMQTCMPESENFSYMMLNLVGEVGEFASKVAKHIRKGKAEIFLNRLRDKDPAARHYGLDGGYMTAKELDDLKKEAGDVLWQLSGLCTVMNWSLEDVAQQNLDKLSSRQERNVIDGNGDNR